MCLVYKYSNRVLVLLLCTLVLFGISGFSQNVTSPYSILGIGDLETKDFGRYFGMGSTSIAMRSNASYNFVNPASLTALDSKVMNYDLIMRGRISKYLLPGADTFTSVSKDYAVRRISLAYKPQKKWAFAIGLKPFSTVNYLLSDSGKLADNSSVLVKSVDGNGGLYQIYLSNGFSLNKNFSVGLTTSYIFGSLENNTTYTSEAIGLDITRNEYNALHAYLFTGGLQYAGKINKHVSQQLGIIISSSAKLAGEWSTEYNINDSTLVTDVHNAKHIMLPLQLGIGYALILNDVLTISADYNFYNWQKQSVDYSNSYIDKAARFSAGVEYKTQTRMGLQMREKYYFQTGFSYETGYLHIQDNPLNDYSFSAGFGNNVSRFFSYHLGFEVGTKGSVYYNQIKEKYTQFVIGISAKDFWFNIRKYGQYQ